MNGHVPKRSDAADFSGWVLKEELLRDIYSKKSGSGPLMAVFDYVVKRGGVVMPNHCEYPGQRGYTREQLKEGIYPRLHGISISLCKEALEKFPAVNNVWQMPVAKTPAVRQEHSCQMAASIPADAQRFDKG